MMAGVRQPNFLLAVVDMRTTLGQNKKTANKLAKFFSEENIRMSQNE